MVSLSPCDVSLFPHDYAEARTQWLSALRRLPADYRTYSCEGAAPGGESLATDVAWIGDERAEAVLVLIAGTHGIEGFAGTAIQRDVLQRIAADELRLPEATACLLIHALTPWGYAWRRRCDADGIDLNRNCVDFNAPLPENPDYTHLRPALFSVDAAQRQHALKRFAEHHGQTALEKAVSGGQYLDPSGPFFGGHRPAHGRRVCEAVISHHQLAKRRLAVIDLHTGLGPYGHGEIICDHDPGSAGALTAQRWYGDAVTLPLAGTSSSVPKSGLLDYLWHAVMDEDSCFVTLEFGSHGTDALFDVLLDDHRLWAAPAIDQTARDRQARAMMRHFCPNDVVWRELVLFRARQVIGQALRGVAA